MSVGTKVSGSTSASVTLPPSSAPAPLLELPLKSPESPGVLKVPDALGPPLPPLLLPHAAATSTAPNAATRASATRFIMALGSRMRPGSAHLFARARASRATQSLLFDARLRMVATSSRASIGLETWAW